MKRTSSGFMAAVLAFSVTLSVQVIQASASLLFDRGLPTENLNAAAGTLRSNVGWSDWEPTATTSPYYLPGDDFTIGTGGSYHIDKIRVWATTNDSSNIGFKLFGGQAGSSISLWSSTYTPSNVTYINGEDYQGNSGEFRQIYQIDFAVNLDISGGVKYQFFLDSPWSAYTNPAGFSNAFLHASNKDRSGHSMPGADDIFLYMTMDGIYPNGIPGVVIPFDMTAYGLTSDGNIQVYGTPLPGTLLLLGSGLTGLVLWRRRKAGVERQD